jgi:hypothetical protein
MLISPPEESVSHVLNFISSFDVVVIDPLPQTQDFIRVSLPTSEAEKMLNCPFYTFTHSTSSSSALSLTRCQGSYSLPSSVADLVAFVGGVTHFPNVRKARTTSTSIGLTVNPGLIRDRYAIGTILGGQSANNSQAVAQFLGQVSPSLPPLYFVSCSPSSCRCCCCCASSSSSSSFPLSTSSLNSFAFF